jgi:[acyl-carrier-protein] S-malonyltransferase
MKSSIIFPGQGSQHIGMGKDFYDNFTVAKNIFEEVNDALNYNLSDIIFNGPIEDLTLTQHTQPALMAVSIAILETIKSELKTDIDRFANFVAGHSLGEYSALCATNSISLSDTAKLLQIRGESMQTAVPKGKGSMAAILSMEENEVDILCKEVSNEIYMCQIANDNCPGQIVVSGHTEAIDKLIEAVTSKSKKAIKLSVSAPFHCSLMDPVQIIMDNALSNTTIHQPILPLVANVTANIVTKPIDIKNNLVTQVSSRVRWNESMNFLISSGVDNFIEIGAGKVLSGLMKRIDKTKQALNISTVDDMKKFFEIIK